MPDHLTPIYLPDGSIIDPPGVAEYAARGNPPPGKWPGRTIGREDVAMASGDPRDWFRYGHRLEAAEDAWLEWRDAYRRRKSLFPGFDWNQIAIIGEFGAGKTLLANYAARHWFGLGHPVFSNASTLFGWRVSRERVYTSMGSVPKCSALIIDEGSAALSSRMAAGVAVDSFYSMGLNIRKQNCALIVISAQDHMIAASVRRDCKEVWMPVPKADLVIENSELVDPQHLDPASDIDNFRLAWHVWDDYPYRKANLIEGPQETKVGFGKPAYTMYADGDEVRRAYLLTDSFELAQAGAARIADTDLVREDIEDFHAEHWGHEDDRVPRNQQQIAEMMHFFEISRYDADRQHFQAGEVASYLGVSLQKAGLMMRDHFPGIENVQRKGYPAAFVYKRIAELTRQLNNGHSA